MSKGIQAVIFSDDRKQILLIKRNDFPVWTLPGGRKEENEALRATVVREVKEETGLRVKIKKEIGDYQVWYLPFIGLTKVFLCEKVAGHLQERSEEAKEIRFWPIKALPKTMLPYIRRRLWDVLNSNY